MGHDAFNLLPILFHPLTHEVGHTLRFELVNIRDPKGIELLESFPGPFVGVQRFLEGRLDR